MPAARAAEFTLLPQSRKANWEPIDTDRPTFTRSTRTVPRGAIQYEGGYVYEYLSEPGVQFETHVFPGVPIEDGSPPGDAPHRGFRANVFPGSLLRYGLTDRVELRLVWIAAHFEEITSGGVRRGFGATDLGLGAKVRLGQQDGWMPETSAIVGLTLPSGAWSFTNEQAEFHFNLLYRWELGRDWWIAGSTGLRTQTGLGDHYMLYHQSVVLEKWFTPSFQLFVEYFGVYFDGYIDDLPENYAHTGLRFRPAPNLQFDWHLGTGLQSNALDYFTGAGLAVRF